jgi:hypothetical protein
MIKKKRCAATHLGPGGALLTLSSGSGSGSACQGATQHALVDCFAAAVVHGARVQLTIETG